MRGVYCERCGSPCDTGMNCLRGCKRVEMIYTTDSSGPPVPPCKHLGWSFAEHGRRCHHCGKTLVDLGE